MKRIFSVLPLIALLAACGGASKPDKTATDFLTAVKEKKWDRATELSTSQYASEVAFGRDFYGDSLFVKEIKDLKCTVSGDSAVCTFCCAVGDKSSITLIKEDKGWKVKGGISFKYYENLAVADTAEVINPEDLVITAENIAESDELDAELDELDGKIRELEKEAAKNKKKK